MSEADATVVEEAKNHNDERENQTNGTETQSAFLPNKSKVNEMNATYLPGFDYMFQVDATIENTTFLEFDVKRNENSPIVESGSNFQVEETLNNSNSFQDTKNALQMQVKDLQKRLVNEEDKMAKIQKKLYESENQRLITISQNNKELFNLNTQYTRLRSDFERKEACRQTLEYELSLARSNCNKEKQISSEKDKTLEDITATYQTQIKVLSKENSDLKMKLKNIEIEFSKEEMDRQQLMSIHTEQDNVISALRDENNLNREILEKYKMNNEFYKDKEERQSRECEQYLNRIKSLEEMINKEKSNALDLKLNLEMLQLKNKEYEDKLQLDENRKLEIELNIDKLMEQLKENRKETQEEQFKNKEMRERFLIIETQLKSANAELTKKLSEKNSTIKDLSNQLTVHEINFEEVKSELQKTKQKQSELDSVFNSCMHDIEKITNLCSFLPNDIEYHEFKHYLKKSNRKNIKQTPSLAHSVSILKLMVEDLKNFLIQKLKMATESKSSLEEQLRICQEKEKSSKESPSIKEKYDRDIAVLRSERVALEEVIGSLKCECEHFKSNLNREFDTTNALNAQLSRLNKHTKELEEQRTALLQSFYKRMLPVHMSNKRHLTKTHSKPIIKLPTELKENVQHELEQQVDMILADLIERLADGEQQIETLEKDNFTKQEQLQRLQKKYDDQIGKLTKIFKEKEMHFSKQKDSLVAYYEQLLNDVNSRVKLYIDGYMKTPFWSSQNSIDDTWNKLKDSDVQKKNFEVECNRLKEEISKLTLNERTLNTTCFLLIGIVKSLTKQNSQYREQKKVLLACTGSWLSYKNQLNTVLDLIVRQEEGNDSEPLLLAKCLCESAFRPIQEASSCKASRTEARTNANAVRQQKLDTSLCGENQDMANVVDYSVSSSMVSASLSGASLSPHSDDQSKKPNKHSGRQLASVACRFRRCVIAVIASQRFIYFYKQTKRNCSERVCISFWQGANYHFCFPAAGNSDDHDEGKRSDRSDKDARNVAKEVTSIDNCSEAEKRRCILFSLLSSAFESQLFQKLKSIANNMNRAVYQPNGALAPENSSELLKQSVLKCKQLFEATTKADFSKKRDSTSLICQLGYGLKKLCHKNGKVASHFSINKQIDAISKRVCVLNERYLHFKLDYDLLKSQLDAQACKEGSSDKKTKMIQNELTILKQQRQDMVPANKVESVFKELESALQREQQAEQLLRQQSFQIDEMTQRLSHLSKHSSEAFRALKSSAAVDDRQKKEKQIIKQLQKRVASLQTFKENYENSTTSILIDKEMFLNYCNTIKSLLQRSLQFTLPKESADYREALLVIAQISELSISSNHSNPNDFNLKNLVKTFCDNYRHIVVKLARLEDELGSLHKQIQHKLKDGDATKMEQYANNPRVSTLSATSFMTEKLIMLEQECDVSFRKLPGFIIHDEESSAFKSLPVK